MKKLVPDPPPRRTTAYAHLGTCNGAHPPLLAVCADADIEDALVHLSAALTSAFETNAQLCEVLPRSAANLAWATYQSLEIAQALIGAMLNRKGCKSEG